MARCAQRCYQTESRRCQHLHCSSSFFRRAVNKRMSECLSCSSLWGTCTNASSCRNKDRNRKDGSCVSCQSSQIAGCILSSASTESECTTKHAKKAINCSHGYIPRASFCKDDIEFCYMTCTKDHNVRGVVILCIAGGLVLLFLAFALLR